MKGKRNKKAAVPVFIFWFVLFAGCSSAVSTGYGFSPASFRRPGNTPPPDGYYTAEMAEFDSYGWKEFVSISVHNGHIASVEYNAKNSSGFIKSWDMNYMRLMNAANGTYPNEYTRIYAGALLDTQNPDHVDAISGASNSHRIFVLLSKTALKQARAGAKEIARVIGEESPVGTAP